ncbi:NAD(P)-binding protein [Whalleya microplaca]|nr:NAD(P)-binding protein [Whalleya microplaca]
MASKYDSNTTAEELVRDYENSIKGKIILTTGVTRGGLGAEFVENVARAKPGMLILAGRNLDKVQIEADSITTAHPDVKVRVLKLDLGLFASVRAAADTVNSWIDVPNIDVLVNNAAVMATPYMLTPDGFEFQFGINHLGHWLFANLIMDKVMVSTSPRVVNISSTGHRFNPIRWHDYNFDNGKTYDKWHGYGQSKTANMLMAISLAEKLGPKGLLSFSVHPGAIHTALDTYMTDWEADYATLCKFFPIRPISSRLAMGNAEGWIKEYEFKTLQQGAATHIYAAFDPDLKDFNGKYLLDSHVGDPWKDTIKPWATSSLEAERLWKLSEELTGHKFNY